MSQVYKLEKYKTAFILWYMIWKENNDINTPMKSIALEEEYHTMKKIKEETISEYVDKMQILAQRLGQVGLQKTEMSTILKIINS